MNRLTQVVEPWIPPYSPVTTYNYENGLLKWVNNPLSFATTFGYDAAGQLVTITDPIQHATTIGYDTAGRVTSLRDPLLRTTTYGYDPDGRLASVTEPGAVASTNYAYDPAGNLIRVTDPLGHFTQYTFDNAERLSQIIGPDPDGTGAPNSSVTTYNYDLAGRIVSMIDPENSVTSYEYDLLGKLRKFTAPDPDGTGSQVAAETRWDYNTLGLVTRVTDPNGNVTRYLYDSALRLWKSINSDGVLVNGQPRELVTEFTYDREDRTRSVRDASGNLTQFFYDPLERLVNEIGPSSLYSTAYTYDAARNLTSVRDELLRRREFVYDAADRLRIERWRAPQTDTVLRSIDYAYSDADELVSVSDRDVVNGVPASQPRSSLAFSYDAAGRPASVDNAGTPQVPNVLLNYSHDAAGRRTRLTNTMPGAPAGLPAAATAGFVTYAHDNANRPTRIQDGTISGGSLVNGVIVGGTDVVSKTVDFTYNRRDQFATISRYLGTPEVAGAALVTQASFTYDAAGRLTDILHSGPQPSTLNPQLGSCSLLANLTARLACNTTAPATTMQPSAAGCRRTRFGSPLVTRICTGTSEIIRRISLIRRAWSRLTGITTYRRK